MNRIILYLFFLLLLGLELCTAQSGSWIPATNPSNASASDDGMEVVQCYFVLNNSNEIVVTPDQQFTMVLTVRHWNSQANAGLRSQLVVGIADLFAPDFQFDGYAPCFPSYSEVREVLNWTGGRQPGVFDITLNRYYQANGAQAASLYPGGGQHIKKKIAKITMLAQTAIPGIPVAGGSPLGVQSQSRQNNGIAGLRIVQEDIEYEWTGSGETQLMLAPDSDVRYTFDFGDRFNPQPVSGCFNPFRTSNISRSIAGNHKYTESGNDYEINLVIDVVTREYNPDGTFLDSPLTLKAGPFKVVVVDHMPDFGGTAVPFLVGPGNVTDKTVQIDGITDVIYEDPESDVSGIKVGGLFKFYSELKPGTDTGVKPDRFSGVDPKSVRYWLDFGDGKGEQLFDWPEVNKLSPGSGSEILKQVSFMSKPHRYPYSEPGEYDVVCRTGFKTVSFEEVSFDGKTYTWRKIADPERVMISKRKVVVIDRTPPRLLASELKKLAGTTGDPLEISFTVDDNHALKDLKEAEIQIEEWGKKDSFKPYKMDIEYLGPDTVRGRKYRLSCKTDLRLPENFASKEGNAVEFLRYKLRISDSEGNVNDGKTSITEDRPPWYGNNGPTAYGKLRIYDNDPPSLCVKVTLKEKLISHVKIEEKVSDFQGNVHEYGKVSVCDEIAGSCTMLDDCEKNPLPFATGLIGITLPDSFALRIPEDTRFQVEVTTTDNVDAGAQKVMIGTGLENMQEFADRSALHTLIYSNPGPAVLIVQVNDRKNSDSTCSFRRILVPVQVGDSQVYRKTVGR